MIQLRNKKSGKIATLVVDGALKYVQAFAVEDDSMERLGEYKTLAELNAEWEDAPEEPKEHWAIDQFGEPINVSSLSRLQLEKLHRLGNDFPSENATMKAVERLRAWQRIKEDLGSLHWQDEKDGQFSVWGQFYGNMLANDAILNIHRKDLDLLFGGEND